MYTHKNVLIRHPRMMNY